MYRSFVNSAGTITTEAVPSDHQAGAGETLFSSPPSDEQIAEAFPAASLAAAIARRCDEVDAVRDAKFDGGMGYGGKVLQLRDIDQQRIIAAGAQAKFAVLTNAAWPAEFAWIMADNSTLPLDKAAMSTMADAAAAQVQAWIFAGHGHKQTLRALTDIAAVAAHDISTGW